MCAEEGTMDCVWSGGGTGAALEGSGGTDTSPIIGAAITTALDGMGWTSISLEDAGGSTLSLEGS